MKKTYRIVRYNFAEGNENFQVQVQYWRQVPKRSNFMTLEEAEERMQHLQKMDTECTVSVTIPPN